MAFSGQLPPPTSIDGNPPPAPGAGAPQPPSMQQLSPGTAFGGTMQVAQIVMQAAAQAAKLIDMIGQVQPAFAPTAQMLIQQLKGGITSTLQQGMAQPGASLAQLGGGPGAQASAGPSQAGPPQLPSGM